MAQIEPLMFVTGSKTLDIPHHSVIVKAVANKNGIQSERFTVGRYDWVLEYYPQGINESSSDFVSVSVKVLNAMEQVRAVCSFYLWDWTFSKWLNTVSSGLITFSPSGGKACWGLDKYNRKTTASMDLDYLKDDTLRIRCTLFVTPRPPALKSDFDNPAGNGNHNWNPSPSGTDYISFGNGFHTASYAPPNVNASIEYTKLPRQLTVRIYCKANNDLSLTARNGFAVLAPADSNDYYQHWIKDMSYGDKVKGASGFPAFALVNRVTGEAIQNPAEENKQVRLVPYNLKYCLEDSLKWTEEFCTGFRAISIADNTILNLTAIASTVNYKYSDGAKIVVQNWENKLVQYWTMLPCNSN